MSKRAIDDVEGASATAFERANKKKRKEKKPKDASVASTECGVESALERREKRKRKEKKEKADKKNDSDATETSTPEPRPSKEERKAAKKAAKVAKKLAVANSTSDISSTASADSTPAPTPSGGISAYTQDAALSLLPESEITSYLTQHSITISNTPNALLRPIISFLYLPPHSFDFSAFKSPTPIQAATWPFTLSGHDCIGVAETGSGKTLAFSVPAIRHIRSLLSRFGAVKKLGVRVLVVSPTRELAMQIFEVVEKYSKDAGVRAVCLYGGAPKEEQRARLRKAQVVVATPGRLKDFIEEGSCDISKVSYLVLDEADRMLDKGFEEDIRRIISGTPSSRQTLMFTATWPQSVRELASTFMRHPVKITIGDRDELRANIRISQTVEVLDQRSKEHRLQDLLRQHQSGAKKDHRILVFCLYKKEAARVESVLRSRGHRVAGIHGDLSQAQRTQALERFKRGECPLLIATDVAARGLDIPNVKMVINVTFPLTIEDYVHRIGRTGRAGADGIAHTFFTENDKALSGALINVLKAASQDVPESLLKFGTTVKKKEHAAYGAFYKDINTSKKSTKITFD